MSTPEQSTKTSFLPDFCNIRMTFAVILLAELLAIVIALTRAWNAESFIYDLALISLFIQVIALSSAAGLCLTRNLLNSLEDHWVVIVSYALIMVIAFIIIQLVWLYLHNDAYFMNDQLSHLGFSIRCLLVTAITAALVLRYLFVRHQWRQQIEAESRARIAAMQARIRPHFLFNCMNTIASLTRKDPKLAEESIENLSALFRASLQNNNASSTLAEELELCQQYLAIEQHRLGERLDCHWQIDESQLNLRIPTLTLQPLVENAIYHGIERLENGGKIHISIQAQQQQTIIEIQNPLATGNDSHSGNQLAQENVRQRLQAFYGEDVFNLSQQNDHYRVTITLPAR